MNHIIRVYEYTCKKRKISGKTLEEFKEKQEQSFTGTLIMI